MGSPNLFAALAYCTVSAFPDPVRWLAQEKATQSKNRKAGRAEEQKSGKEK